ncbi:fasciclin domain-containing protein [Dysgonomonas hofstadii]|nr:fasciclin domain-containing protein [Dysgonomonas hofstadii]
MNMYISKNTIVKVLGCLIFLVNYACSNAIDDYYKGGQTITREETILQYLEETPDYSEFVQLINETGMRDILSGKDLVTVWAPVNSTIPQNVATMSDTEKLRLVRNHISITTIFSRNLDRLSTVGTMAGKYLNVGRISDGYTVDGVRLSELDQVFQNGVVHKAGEWLVTRKNLQQWLEEAGDEYSMFRDTLFTYNHKVFDKDSSPIIGVDENGQIIHDSVWVIENELLKNIDLNDESARYTLFVPNNDAFKEMFKEKTAYLESIGREVADNDESMWINWMMKAALHEGTVNFQPSQSIKSVNDLEIRSDYQVVLSPIELSNGRIYPMTTCYVPRNIYFTKQEFNPYYLRKEIVDNGGGLLTNPGTYDSYKSTINNVNSKLIDNKLAFFLQYTTNFNNNYYQFKSCSWDEEALVNTPLNIMPGKYSIMCHFVSQKNTEDNETDILEVYQVHSETESTFIGRAEGIVAGAYDQTLDGKILVDEYEVKGMYEPLELKVVVPGSYTQGYKRRICVGKVTLIPADNY